MNAQATAAPQQPILLRSDDDYLEDLEDKLEQVFDKVLMGQAMLEDYYDDIQEDVSIPWVSEQLEMYQRKAQDHRERARSLYDIIDREPSDWEETKGHMMSTMDQLVDGMMGLGEGAYPSLQMLLMMELQTTGSWGLTVQTGVAAGVPEVQQVAKPIVMEKFGQWRWFQETVMELGPLAILEEEPI